MDLAQAIEEQLARFRDSLLRIGTVTGTSGTKVVLTIEGQSMTLPRSTAYTPVNGDVVWVFCLKPGAWFVVGKPA
jgi:hypothetical protein